jgi:N,N'-diacetylchitobiose phosphorylase
VENPAGVEKGVKSVDLDGKRVSGPIPAQAQGSSHEVLVVMG